MSDEVVRGGQAQEVLESQVFKDASAAVRSGIVAQMGKVPIKDTEMHTKLILTLQLWDSLEKYLQGIVATGKMAQYQIQQEEKHRNFMNLFR